VLPSRTGHQPVIGVAAKADVYRVLLVIRTTRPMVFEAVAWTEAGLATRLETGLARVVTIRMLQQFTRGTAQILSARRSGVPPSETSATDRLACLLGALEEPHLAMLSPLLR
jgi:acyl-CoA dehydrogenase